VFFLNKLNVSHDNIPSSAASKPIDHKESLLSLEKFKFTGGQCPNHLLTAGNILVHLSVG